MDSVAESFQVTFPEFREPLRLHIVSIALFQLPDDTERNGIYIH